jgi:hypothetical protein
MFNVAYLYPYRGDGMGEVDDQEEVQWMQQIPIAEKLQIENILEQRIAKRTRRKVYYEYLVKWKDHPVEDASWLTKADIQKHGK